MHEPNIVFLPAPYQSNEQWAKCSICKVRKFICICECYALCDICKLSHDFIYKHIPPEELSRTVILMYEHTIVSTFRAESDTNPDIVENLPCGCRIKNNQVIIARFDCKEHSNIVANLKNIPIVKPKRPYHRVKQRALNQSAGDWIKAYRNNWIGEELLRKKLQQRNYSNSAIDEIIISVQNSFVTSKNNQK